jgi:hypothetical protein
MRRSEPEMLRDLEMPARKDVERALLEALFRHGGTIQDFSSGQKVVAEIADRFHLTTEQRTAILTRTYFKENREVRSPLWHRLLFRAADALAGEGMVSRPTATLKLTNRKEWMLTEKGFDAVLKLSQIPIEQKAELSIKSFEVQEIVKKMSEAVAPPNYDPIDKGKRVTKTTRLAPLRSRGFQHAVIAAYDYKCAVCNLRIQAPHFSRWEVEAAHIVPNSSLGRDDIWNGISLCHLHHWLFDVGWFTLLDNFGIIVSKRVARLPHNFGKIGDFDVFKSLRKDSFSISLPKSRNEYPHRNALEWHRQHVFRISQNK